MTSRTTNAVLFEVELEDSRLTGRVRIVQTVSSMALLASYRVLLSAICMRKPEVVV